MAVTNVMKRQNMCIREYLWDRLICDYYTKD